VLVSAFTTRGICSDSITLVLAGHQLVLGETVLAELSRVLDLKMRMPKISIEEAEALLRREAVVVSHGADISVSVRDPDDVAVLAESVEGSADVLVTGDRDLLDIPMSLRSRYFFGAASGKGSKDAPGRRLPTSCNSAARPAR
jgi:uncharacterized protein